MFRKTSDRTRELQEYSSILKHKIWQKISKGVADNGLLAKVLVEHSFLESKYEALLEQKAIFEKANDSKFKELHVDPLDVVVAQVGRSSTQVYTPDRNLCISFLVGVEEMDSNPLILGDLCRNVVEYIRKTFQSDRPIIFMNAISRWVAKDVIFEENEWVKPQTRDWGAVVKPLESARNKSSEMIRTIEGTIRGLEHLATVIQDLKLSCRCRLIANNKDKIEGDWVDALYDLWKERIKIDLPDTLLYVVDLGGGGPDIRRVSVKKIMAKTLQSQSQRVLQM